MPHKTLAQAIENIKARPGMYFTAVDIDSLLDFLVGWDEARGTSWGKTYVEHISKLCNTGCKVPGPDDITFNAAVAALETVIRGSLDGVAPQNE